MSSAIALRVDPIKQLRAHDQVREASRPIQTDGNNELDTSIVVRTRDEKSNLVLQFSNPQKAKQKRGNDSDPTNNFLDKYVKKFDRDTQYGVWSSLGKPYVARGHPDLSLVDKAHQARDVRRANKKKRMVVGRDANSKKTIKTWGGDLHAGRKQASSAEDQTFEFVDQSHKRSIVQELILYRFPHSFIAESEKRCRQSKNGIPFAQIIREQQERCGQLFETLQLPERLISSSNSRRTNSTRGSSRISAPSSSRTLTKRSRSDRSEGLASAKYSTSAASRSSILDIVIPNTKQQETTKKSRLHIKGNELVEWQRQFAEIRDEAHRTLKETLAANKIDRFEVYQNQNLLANVAHICKGDRTSPLSVSVWTYSKQQNAKRDQFDLTMGAQEEFLFYREFLVFVERVFGDEIQNSEHHVHEAATHRSSTAHQNSIMEIVLQVKRYLEEGNRADVSLFFDILQNQGQLVLQNAKCLELFKFLRKYFEVSDEELTNFMFKLGWHMSANVKSFLMGHSDTIL